MSERSVSRRVLLLALVGTLVFRLLAFMGGSGGTVRAEILNQTIPTLTPTGQVSSPTPQQPPQPTTPVPTAPPGEPTYTPSPTPSTEVTSTPTVGTPSPTATVPAESATPTPGPIGTTETPPPGSSETATAQPTVTASSPGPAEPTSTPTRSAAPEAPSVEVTVTPLLQLTQTAEALQTGAPDAESDGILSFSCLWIVAGLVLIAAGVVLLVRRRHPK